MVQSKQIKQDGIEMRTEFVTTKLHKDDYIGLPGSCGMMFSSDSIAEAGS